MRDRTPLQPSCDMAAGGTQCGSPWGSLQRLTRGTVLRETAPLEQLSLLFLLIVIRPHPKMFDLELAAS